MLRHNHFSESNHELQIKLFLFKLKLLIVTVASFIHLT